jgi:hypothetical protein
LLHEGTWKWRIQDGTQFDTVSNSGGATDTRLHIAVTYDGSTARMYLNGVAQTSTQSTAAPTTGGSGAFLIGQLGSNFYPLTGFIDELRVYDHALSQSEIDRIRIRARAR